LRQNEEIWPKVVQSSSKTHFHSSQLSNFINHHHIGQIDADAVVNALEAKNYRDMLKKLKEKFPTRSAFADIKAWLTAIGITFEETDSES